MNRKHNPWVALVALILLATILVMACTGCSAATAEAETVPRFTCEQAGRAKGMDLYIITDTETGVQYLLAEKYGHGYGIGLTKLEEVNRGKD